MFGRKILLAGVSLAVILAAGLSAAPVFADTDAHGEQHVYVLVSPNITIGGQAAEHDGCETCPGGTPGHGSGITYVDLGSIQTGKFCGLIRWRVDANTEAVRFCVAASDLWKGDDPVGASVDPIDLLTEDGVWFAIELGSAALGQSPHVAFNGHTQLGDFPAYQTRYVTFESSQNGHFSQYVVTKVCWIQDDPEKPTGQYSGVVALWGFVVPTLGPQV